MFRKKLMLSSQKEAKLATRGAAKLGLTKKDVVDCGRETRDVQPLACERWLNSRPKEQREKNGVQVKEGLWHGSSTLEKKKLALILAGHKAKRQRELRTTITTIRSSQRLNLGEIAKGRKGAARSHGGRGTASFQGRGCSQALCARARPFDDSGQAKQCHNT